MTVSRYAQAKKVTLIGAVINFLLGFSKLWAGIQFQSHALFADGVHSFSDLITDFMILFAAKWGSLDADDSHPYGHQRIETAATLLLALLLILAGAGIAWDALEAAFKETHIPHIAALWVVFLSIMANEILFHYTLRVGKKIESALIIANAWHHRSDAASSLVVAIGLIGSLAGFAYCDAIAAIIVGFLIIKMGGTYGWNSVQELIDTSVDTKTLCEIERIIQLVDGVKKIHQLRSRLMGGDILIDVHILVDSFISVSEGHYIAQHVHHNLLKQFQKVKDVTVHVDPEDDEACCPSFSLPNRMMLEKNLLLPWQNAFPCIKNWTLHYIDGKIRIDLLCEIKKQGIKALQTRVEQDIANTPIQEVYFRLIPC